MSMDEARSDQERQNIKKLFRNSLLIALGLSAVLTVPLYFSIHGRGTILLFFALLFSQTIVIYFFHDRYLHLRHAAPAPSLSSHGFGGAICR